MKKTYMTPAFLAVELNMRSVAMLTGSDDTERILDYEGEGNGEDIGAKENRDVNVWDEEW